MNSPSNLPANYEQIYFDICKMAEFAGWKVREYSAQKIGNGNLGYMYHPKKLIAVLKDADILTKISIVAHEFFGHAEQYQYLLQNVLEKYSCRPKTKPHRLSGGLVSLVIQPKSKYSKDFRKIPKKLEYYSKFFLEIDENTEYSDELMEIVVFCEIDASTRAQKVLKEWFGLKDEEIFLSELNPNAREAMIEAWRNYYFRKNS